MYYTSKRFATVSLLAILVAAPFTSAQQQPPPPQARAPGSSPAAPTNPPPPTASTTPATPPVRAPTAATTAPPAAATPPARAPTAATPPTQAATPPQQAAAARAPTVAPTTAAGARPATAPTPAQTAVNPIAPAARSPTIGPTTSAAAALTPGSRIAPAPGPSGSGTVNASAVVTSPGALNSAQQTQLCQTVVGALVGQFPSVSQCTVSSQTAAPQSSFATSGRKLSQATVTLTLGLSLSSATANQLPGIQSILNRLVLNIGGTRTTLVIVNINIIQVNLVPTTAPLPANTPALPSSTTITAATSPATAPAPAATVVTAVPPNATGNTTQNVSAQNAKPPPAPANGTNTVTTITNTTHTTTTTTIAYFVVTTQITIIQQYYFTVLIGQTTGVFTIIVFNLPGNVANNLPLVVTGGAVTGQTATIQVTGATVTTITSTTIATQVTTSTSTSTTTTTTTTPGTPTTPTTPTTPANTRNVCSVPNNPYGLIQNTANEGTLIKGAFLVSSWNDVTGNNPGQGNIIYQCLPDGTATKWATVTVTGACTRDGAGVGLTMALSRCGSVIIVGSLPIPVGGTAKPGCLIALDTSGKVINEVTSPGINGPWGSVCTSSGGQITLALSSVLGGLAPATTTAASGGRRLLAPAPSPSASVTGGFVVRWTFATPTQGSTWTLGPPTFLVQGITTNGSAGVAGGAVGPGGPAVDDQGTIYLPDLLGNRLLKVPNGFTTSTPTSSVLTTSVALNGPNSLYFGQGQLLGANTGDGTLFTVTLDSGRNGGPTTLTQVDPQNTAGVLFNVIYSIDNSAGAPIGSVWFQHDGTSTLNTIVGSGAPSPAPGASTAFLAQGPSRGLSPTSG